jgi:hypothetical protein
MNILCTNDLSDNINNRLDWLRSTIQLMDYEIQQVYDDEGKSLEIKRELLPALIRQRELFYLKYIKTVRDYK